VLIQQGMEGLPAAQPEPLEQDALVRHPTSVGRLSLFQSISGWH